MIFTRTLRLSWFRIKTGRHPLNSDHVCVRNESVNTYVHIHYWQCCVRTWSSFNCFVVCHSDFKCFWLTCLICKNIFFVLLISYGWKCVINVFTIYMMLFGWFLSEKFVRSLKSIYFFKELYKQYIRYMSDHVVIILALYVNVKVVP